MPDLIDQRIGSYEIVALLGKGGMAEVYRARQQLGDKVIRDVALKLIDARLSLTPEFLTRFEREAQTLVSLSHPHILKAFDFGQYQGEIYLVMELLLGGSLAERIGQGQLPLSEVSRLLEQIGQALDYAHSEGVVHRDLKPQNVLLDKSGNAFLTDFGIVKLIGETTVLTQANSAIGTPAYMSPEQWTGGDVDARSDLYSLGVVLFEMLGGRVPFRGDTPHRIMYMHIHDAPPSVRLQRPDLPPSVDQILYKALAKDPEHRYQSAAALVQDFKRVVQENNGLEGVSPGQLSSPTGSLLNAITMPDLNRPTTVLSAPPDTGSRSTLALGLIGLLVALLIAGGVGLAALNGRTIPSATALNVSALSSATLSPDAAPSATLLSAPSSISVAVASSTTVITASNTSVPTKTLSATETNVPASATKTSTPSPSPTLSPIPATHTVSPTPTAVDPLTLAAQLDTQDAQTANAIRTSTATLWTKAPTLTATRTIDVLETANAIRTKNANATGSEQAQRDLTSTATVWSPTPTPSTTQTLTLTSTMPPVHTVIPSVTLTSTPFVAVRSIDSKGIPVVFVPAGCFMMGSDPALDPAAAINEQPRHNVCLSNSYWLDRSTVTNAAYDTFVRDGGYSKQEWWSTAGWQWLQTKKISGPDTSCTKYSAAADKPRVCVNYYEAEAYARWRGGRLPTEAEWEYAARGPQNFIYPWGNSFDPARANTSESNLNATTKVCSYPTGDSWVGACDTAGNTLEWVTDWYNSVFYSKSPANDPMGMATGQYRVIRGGSWHQPADRARTAARGGADPAVRANDGGFRVLLVAATVTMASEVTNVAPTAAPIAGATALDRKGIPIVFVPAGCFPMGSEPGKDLNSLTTELPRHQVCITKGFWLDKSLVTNARFEDFAKDGGYARQSLWSADGWQWLQSNKISGPASNCPKNLGLPDQPRLCVDYYEAEAYARWRGGRLPTEAEWEYAARGPQAFIYPWGDVYDKSRANSMESGLNASANVCQFSAGNSWVGACDMAGNAWEWTTDWFDPVYYASSPQDDPTGPASGQNRVLRGGSWINVGTDIRSAARGSNLPANRNDTVGFRLVAASP